VGRTFVIIKPDGVERGLVGEILGRFERKGLKIDALEHRHIDARTAEQHYGEHKGKDFYEPLMTFITRSPSVLMILSGPDNTWELVRSMMGKTNPIDAAPGSIRGEFAQITRENLVHGSDSPEAAEREIAIFFPQFAN
jgi:nucleoside-diphosphate kinase